MSPSPETAARSGRYESGWIAINRLIREGGTWSGHERNVLYWNRGDGTFSDVSGVSGLDFPEDGRAFALFDFDQDGDLDLVLKNRNSPQLRLLRNDAPSTNHSVAFRLRGTRTNRDAVGARLVLETPSRSYSRIVRSGSGFLSQSSRTVYFGLGPEFEIRCLRVYWPSGEVQKVEGLPQDHLIQLVEGQTSFKSVPFQPRRQPNLAEPKANVPEMIQHKSQFWLTEAIPAPRLELRALDGAAHSLDKYSGRRLLLNFWATWCRPCQTELAELQKHRSEIEARGLLPLLISVDEPSEEETVRRYITSKGLTLPVLFANEALTQEYSLMLRQLLDYATDLVIPTSFLVDETGNIVKVYVGRTTADHVLTDLSQWPKDRNSLLQLALPFPGRSFVTDFKRNWTVFADSFALAGFTDQARAYLQHAVQDQPGNAEALDHLGLIYAHQGQWQNAVESHQRAAELNPAPAAAIQAHLATALTHLGKLPQAESAAQRALAIAPQDPEALRVWAAIQYQQGGLEQAVTALRQSLQFDPENADAYYNLGLASQRRGHASEAADAFRRAAAVNPHHAEALNALGVLLAEEGRVDQATGFFSQAVLANPKFAEAHRNLGIAYARQGKWKEAEESFRAALRLEPHYAEALNGLGGVYLQTHRFQEALLLFQQATRENPRLVEPYMNTARVYIALGQKERAVSVLKALLELHPHEPAATPLLQQLTEENR